MEVWYKAEDGTFFKDKQACEMHEKDAKEARRINIQREMKNLDIAIWSAFHPEDFYKNGDGLTPTNAYLWLQSDIKEILADETRSGNFNEKVARITGILMKSPYYEDICPHFVDIEQLIKHAKISMSLDKALDSVKRGSELSSALGYGLSARELGQLIDLHERGKHRKKIEDLLTNMNFHYERVSLKNKEYDKLREENGLREKEQERD